MKPAGIGQGALAGGRGKRKNKKSGETEEARAVDGIGMDASFTFAAVCKSKDKGWR